MTSGAALPLIFNFAMPVLLANLLQQTYSLIDAAIVGKFLGSMLSAVGASTSVIFLIIGFCNGCCAGFGIPVARSSSQGLQHDEVVCFYQPATGGCHVGYYCGRYKSLLPGYF